MLYIKCMHGLTRMYYTHSFPLFPHALSANLSLFSQYPHPLLYFKELSMQWPGSRDCGQVTSLLANSELVLYYNRDFPYMLS